MSTLLSITFAVLLLTLDAQGESPDGVLQRISAQEARLPTVEKLISDAFAREISRSERGKDMANLLKTELSHAGIKFGFSVVNNRGDLPFGVEWRSAEIDGRALINLVNFSREPIQVTLPDGVWHDLITLKTLPNELTLQTNTPLLAQRLP
jgi:hypothetical protein